MIGEQLRKLRLGRDLKQSDIAVMLGITRTAYTYYENNKRQPPANLLIMLADYFQVSIDYLNGRTHYPGSTPKKDTDEILLLERFRSVDCRGKEAIFHSAYYESGLSEGKKAEELE